MASIPPCTNADNSEANRSFNMIRPGKSDKSRQTGIHTRHRACALSACSLAQREQQNTMVLKTLKPHMAYRKDITPL